MCMAKQREQILLEPEQKQKLQDVSDRTGIPKTEIVRRALDSYLSEGDWWDELPDSVKDQIDIAAKQLDEGMGIPHKEVIAQIQHKYHN